MDVEEPLLRNINITKRRNSVNSMRCDFFSKLPQKVKTWLDPEVPFLLDLSKATDLIEGKSFNVVTCKSCYIPCCVFLKLLTIL